MVQNIFVSFNFTNIQAAQSIRAMVEAWRDDLVGHIIYAEPTAYENSAVENSSSTIKRRLGEVIEQCDIALFVIGDKNQNSPWLNYEVEQALNAKMPIFVTRMPDSHGVTPEQLQDDECMKVSWNADEQNACFTSCLV